MKEEQQTRWALRWDNQRDAESAGVIWQAGRSVGYSAGDRTSNPHTPRTLAHHVWDRGWLKGAAECYADSEMAERRNDLGERFNIDFHAMGTADMKLRRALIGEFMTSKSKEDDHVFILSRFLEIYEAGGLPALLDADEYCRAAGVQTPKWVIDGLAAIARAALDGGRGRHADPYTRYLDDDRHFRRYEAVVAARREHGEVVDEFIWNEQCSREDAAAALGPRPSWEMCYERAAELLQGTSAFSSARTVRASYERVKKDIEQMGASSRYLKGHDWGGFSSASAATLGLPPAPCEE